MSFNAFLYQFNTDITCKHSSCFLYMHRFLKFLNFKTRILEWKRWGLENKFEWCISDKMNLTKKLYFKNILYVQTWAKFFQFYNDKILYLLKLLMNLKFFSLQGTFDFWLEAFWPFKMKSTSLPISHAWKRRRLIYVFIVIQLFCM